MLRLPRLLIMLASAGAISAGGYAYMASNTVAASNVGEASAQVSGYTVTNLDYSGVPAVGNPSALAGTMQYYSAPAPTDGNGISQQDGVTTVSFTLSPNNAHWAAVQLYNNAKQVIGGGGASNCTENLSSGLWTCNVTANGGGPVNAGAIAWIDVEAAQ